MKIVKIVDKISINVLWNSSAKEVEFSLLDNGVIVVENHEWWGKGWRDVIKENLKLKKRRCAEAALSMTEKVEFIEKILEAIDETA